MFVDVLRVRTFDPCMRNREKGHNQSRQKDPFGRTRAPLRTFATQGWRRVGHRCRHQAELAWTLDAKEPRAEKAQSSPTLLAPLEPGALVPVVILVAKGAYILSLGVKETILRRDRRLAYHRFLGLEVGV